jgi:hypothetical protein
MPPRPSSDPTPPPLNEEHMLEWIEGRLSRIEESNRAAAARPGVADRVRQMQANCRALRALGDERAPAELMERVLAALERETLLGLTRGEEVSDHPPISFPAHTVTKSGSGRLERMAPGLALAAGLLLLVGGAVYWGSLLIRPAPRTDRTLAENAAPADVRIAEATPPEPTEVVPTPEQASSEPVATALAAAPAPLTDDRILQLAREGRLLIHVRAGDTRRLAQLESDTTRTWRLSGDVPPEIASVLQPALLKPLDPLHNQPVIAGESGPSRRLDWEPDLPMFEFQRIRETYLIDFPDTQRSLASIRAALADRLRAEVEFEELPEPLPLPRPEADALLWWTLPPSTWTQRVTAPVIIESR